MALFEIGQSLSSGKQSNSEISNVQMFPIKVKLWSFIPFPKNLVIFLSESRYFSECWFNIPGTKSKY